MHLLTCARESTVWTFINIHLLYTSLPLLKVLVDVLGVSLLPETVFILSSPLFDSLGLFNDRGYYGD